MMKYFTARAKGINDPVHAGTGTQATNEYNTKNSSPSSTVPAGNTARDPVGQGGMGSVQQGSNPVSSAGSLAETRDTLDTNKPLPTQPSPGGSRELDTSMTSGSAPHSSGLANKADSRVGSDPYGSTGLETRETTAGGNSLPGRTTSGTTDSGRSFPLGGATTSTTTSGPHDSSLANRADPRVDSDRDGSSRLGNTSYAGTGATVGPAHQGDLSRSAAGNTAGTTTGGSSRTGYSEKTWSHEHNAHGHEYAGDPCADEPPAPGAPHFAPGPHSLDTANRLDPHVSGGGFSGAPLSTAGIFASSTGHDQLRRDAPLGSGATGTQSYEPSHDIPSSTTDGSMSLTGNHHPGRVAESGAGIGGPGARAGVTSRDVPSSSTTEHERTTAGPHSSDMMNQLDPRVDSDLSKQQGYSGATGTTGLGSRSTTDPSTSREHHPGRDAAATGAGGAAFYEGAKHRDRDLLEGTTDSGYANPYPPSSIGAGLAKESSTTGASAHTDPGSTDYSTGLGSGPGSSATRNTTSTDPNTTEKDHHYGRDAGILGAGAGAGAAYEADKHLRGSHGDTTGTRSTDPVSSRQPLSGASGTDYGRDTSMSSPSTAGLHESRYHPSATSGVAGQPSAYDDRNRVKESHIGRDAALGAGAGAGAAAAAGEAEFSKKEAEREQKTAYKEELKEQKAAHKEEEKAAKHHQHEVEKAEKKHQHDVEKAQKAHDKKLEKEEAKHHKEEPKEGEKKHHGLLGLFHREKPDKDLKEDEAARKERVEQEAHPGADTTAASAGGAIAGTEGLTEKEKHGRAKEHDRNRLHKDPPPGYADVPTKGVTERGDTIDSDRRRDGEGRLTEPHTGLPINTQKGDGAGGTDSTPIAGYHPEQSGTHGTDTITTSGEGGGFGHFQDHAR